MSFLEILPHQDEWAKPPKYIIKSVYYVRKGREFPAILCIFAGTSLTRFLVGRENECVYVQDIPIVADILEHESHFYFIRWQITHWFKLLLFLESIVRYNELGDQHSWLHFDFLAEILSHEEKQEETDSTFLKKCPCSQSRIGRAFRIIAHVNIIHIVGGKFCTHLEEQEETHGVRRTTHSFKRSTE